MIPALCLAKQEFIGPPAFLNRFAILLEGAGGLLKAKPSHNLLPDILARRAKVLTRTRSIHADKLDRVEADVYQLEDLLKKYAVDFPFFIKVDAWKSYSPDPEYDLWVLERIGWGKWKDEYQVLFCLEGLPIPKMEDAEVVSVNSASPPFLISAKDLQWTEEILPEEVQASELARLPYALKEKVYPYLDELVLSLGETIDQMEAYGNEFSDYLEGKIDEYLKRFEHDPFHTRTEAIQAYFRSDRRVELFYEFLEALETAETPRS